MEDVALGLMRELNIADADGLYALIIEAHNGLSSEQSVALNARLVLLLANHIGEPAVLQEAIVTARQSLARQA